MTTRENPSGEADAAPPPDDSPDLGPGRTDPGDHQPHASAELVVCPVNNC